MLQQRVIPDNAENVAMVESPQSTDPTRVPSREAADAMRAVEAQWQIIPCPLQQAIAKVVSVEPRDTTLVTFS
jgi:hypothetical protein